MRLFWVCEKGGEVSNLSGEGSAGEAYLEVVCEVGLGQQRVRTWLGGADGPQSVTILV